LTLMPCLSLSDHGDNRVHRKPGFAFWGFRRFRRLLQFLWVFNSGDFGNHGNFGNLLRPSAYVPSARTPPPISVLLKTKAKVQFDRAVTERSKPFFCRFCQPNRCHFAGLFALVTLCRLICRQWVANVPKAARRNDRRDSTVIVSERHSREPNDLKPELQI